MSIIDYIEQGSLDWDELSPAQQMGLVVSPFSSFEEHMEYVHLIEERLTTAYAVQVQTGEISRSSISSAAHEQLWLDNGQRKCAYLATRFIRIYGLQSYEDRLRNIGYSNGSKPDTMDELPF